MAPNPELPRVIIPLPRALIARVDEHRFSHRFVSRAAAIRDLLETGLEHQPKRVIMTTRRVEP